MCIYVHITGTEEAAERAYARRTHRKCASVRAVFLCSSEDSKGTARTIVLGMVARERSRRWLQDTSKRKLADILIVLVPPPSCFPGFTRG